MGTFIDISKTKAMSRLSIILCIICTTAVLWKEFKKPNIHIQNEQSPELTEDARQRLLEVVDSPELFEDQFDIRRRSKFILEPQNLIEEIQQSPEGRWVVINFIKSATTNRDRRDVIRKTWASMKFVRGSHIQSIFLLGKNDKNSAIQSHIEGESKECNDILQTDIPDHYKHVAMKVLSGMQWASENLPKHWLYSSVDDDVTLHPLNLIKYLDTFSDTEWPSDRVFVNSFPPMPILCIYNFKEEDEPDRNSQSKRFISRNTYSPIAWPPYCRGEWYTMPVVFASKLYEVSRRAAYLHLDDVWITGLMRMKLFAQITNLSGSSLLYYGISAAPLSERSRGNLLERKGEHDFNKVIVS